MIKTAEESTNFKTYLIKVMKYWITHISSLYIQILGVDQQ